MSFHGAIRDVAWGLCAVKNESLAALPLPSASFQRGRSWAPLCGGNFDESTTGARRTKHGLVALHLIVPKR